MSHGVIAQILCKKIPKGRCAALEILIGTSAVAANIRDGKTRQLPSIMQTGSKLGMRLLNDSLMELVKIKQVEPLEAYMKAVDKGDMLTKLKGAGFPLDPSAIGESPAGGSGGGGESGAPEKKSAADILKAAAAKKQ